MPSQHNVRRHSGGPPVLDPLRAGSGHQFRNPLIDRFRLFTLCIFSIRSYSAFRYFKQPPRARSVFTGDTTGGSGWEIETEAGPTKKFYVQMPASLPALSLDSKIHLVGAPAELQDLPAVIVCERYLHKLSNLMATAKSRFQCDQTFYFSNMQ